MWKRISAWLFDLIITCTVIAGFAFLISLAFGYDSHIEALEQKYRDYEAEYGISLEIEAEEYEALTEEQKAKYEIADKAFSEDAEAQQIYYQIFNLTLITVIFSVLFGMLLMEFILPLIFGNGQTLGKKIFGIGVMRIDSVKINPAVLLIRTLLGKYTIETMLPLLLLMMIFFGLIGIGGTLLICLILLTNIVMMCATVTNSAIHDMLANTVTVDIASQMIFDTEEDMLAYKQRMHEEAMRAERY